MIGRGAGGGKAGWSAAHPTIDCGTGAHSMGDEATCTDGAARIACSFFPSASGKKLKSFAKPMYRQTCDAARA